MIFNRNPRSCCFLSVSDLGAIQTLTTIVQVLSFGIKGCRLGLGGLGV